VTPEEALRLIEQGEGQRVEFKKSLAEENQAIEALCAFANADGGTVLFGVRNDGTIAGVSLGDNTTENLANKIARSLFPQMVASIQAVTIDDKTVLAVHVDRVGKGKVVFTGSAPVRSGSTNQQLSWDEIRDRILVGESDWSEERHRPRFEVRREALRSLETDFEPQMAVRHVSGDHVGVLEWRFRGPRFLMDWRQASGSALGRTHFAERFDVSQPRHEDDRVDRNEMGFDIRFHWLGRLHHELHRWGMARRDLFGTPIWDIGDEILPPLYFDEADEGETTG
jgi:hypothetical protein